MLGVIHICPRNSSCHCEITICIWLNVVYSLYMFDEAFDIIVETVPDPCVQVTDKRLLSVECLSFQWFLTFLQVPPTTHSFSGQKICFSAVS